MSKFTSQALLQKLLQTLVSLLALVCFWQPTLAANGDSEKLDYSRDIRRILSENCFTCHGPDANAREADLRLDRASDATADRGGYRAIVPGHPDESLIIQRMISDDEFEQMPPPDSKKSVSAEQIKLVKRWISQGAEFSEHWSFVPPNRPALPTVQQSDWPRNPIDCFVLARLEEAGLGPSHAADRYTLIRRLYLDLLGIPPSAEQADAFVNDPSESAYERLVDQVLASPAYGERWARPWLDLARYSDTNGYEKDRPRTVWPYRDWVIDALNGDMPFDQFSIEQIAGDMLPTASDQQRIATGFHRNTMINEEGGIDPQEFRFLAVVDRVATTGTTWLGLTMGCAQCHSHKYDPISQEEYYRFFALLNNADEPTLDVKLAENVRQQADIESRIANISAQLPTLFPVGDASDDATDPETRSEYLASRFRAWCEETAQAATCWDVLSPTHVETQAASIDILQDDSVLVSGDQTKNDIFTVTVDARPQVVTGLRLETLPHQSLPDRGPGRRVAGQGASAGVGDFFLSKISLHVKSADGQMTTVPFCDASATFAAKDRDAKLAIDEKGDTGWSIAGRPGERHVAVFNLKEPVTIRNGDQLVVRLEHESFYPSGLGRFRLAVTDDAGQVTASLLPDNILQLLLIDPTERDEPSQSELKRYFLSVAKELEAQHKKIADLRKQIPKHPTTLVMQERPTRHQRTTQYHHRGEFLQAKHDVEPQIPECLHSFPEGTAPNRLALARWLVARENPLVARVVVNRHWQSLFGLGIVRTTEDFGMQGQAPTHPLLLDWLAVEFMESGWSVKRLHRLIVTSATYRQSASTTDAILERDPENALLTRGARKRMDAELVRDVVLSASGQLSSKIGGPSVFPPQPPGITENSYGPLAWHVSPGEDRYRRGLYTFSKRTAPYAMFGIFDAPSGEACVPRRTNSNTPLQALNMLNDPVVVQAAQVLARQAIAMDDPVARLRYLFRSCLTRPPQELELSAVQDFYQSELHRFESHQANPYFVAGGGLLREWSFAESADGWMAQHQCSIEAKDGELHITSNGNDPFVGTEVTGAAGQYLLKIRARTAAAGPGQIFWRTTQHPTEAAERSANFALVPGKWHVYQVPLTFASDLVGLRLDPGAEEGLTTIDWIRISYGHTPMDVPVGANIDELAALTLVSRALMNLDEMITNP